MKKTAKIALLGFAILALGATTLRAGADRLIKFAELPQSAQAFVKKHFASEQVARVELDKDGLFSKSYEVLLSSGTKIEFNSKGEWRDIDGHHKAIPLSAVPAPIQAYVKKNHPGEDIVQIDKTDVGRYEVELSTGTELLFGRNFKLVSVED